MNYCSHRYKRLVIDFGVAESFQIVCAVCMVTTDPQNSGIAAWHAWLRARRLDNCRVNA